jgi:hypothetical protein
MMALSNPILGRLREAPARIGKRNAEPAVKRE